MVGARNKAACALACLRLTRGLGLAILALMLVASRLAIAASPETSITLSIEADEVYLGDTILLVVESVGLVDPIDVSILSKAAQFERETTGTRIFVINGKVVEVKLRRMEFTPEKTGSIVFGPVTSGDVSSNSVAINVLDEVRSDWVPAPDDLDIKVRVSNTSPYVYSQLLLDIALRHRYPITEENIMLPELDGFTTRPVYEKRRTYTSDSRELRQITWRYLLFPERSGELSIGPVSWTGTTIKSRPERAEFERRSKPVTLSVVPSRSDTDQWWLPTERLTLTESWSSEITALRAGDEVTRTISVSANNVLAGQIPAPLLLESHALSQTLIKTDRNEKVSTNGVMATAQFVYRVKAQSPIPVFLDTVRLPWWNTRTDEPSEAIIPARRINVGLPDRADLLKKLAESDIGVSRFDQWWFGANRFRVALYTLALLATTPFIFLLLRHSFKRLAHRASTAKRRRRLLELVASRQWSQLIDELAPYYRAPYNNTDKALLNTIRKKLYGSGQVELDVTAIESQIKTLDFVPAPKQVAASALAPL